MEEVATMTAEKQLEEEIPEQAETSELTPEEEQFKGEWYVVHTYSGYENKIKVDLTKRVESMNMQDKIFDIIIPEEQEVEYKGGKRKVTSKRVFPG